MSAAQIAEAYGISDIIALRWRKVAQHQCQPAAAHISAAPTGLVSVSLPLASMASPDDPGIEGGRRGGAVVVGID